MPTTTCTYTPPSDLEGSDQDIKLRLHGGSFQAVERHLELQAVGDRLRKGRRHFLPRDGDDPDPAAGGFHGVQSRESRPPPPDHGVQGFLPPRRGTATATSSWTPLRVSNGRRPREGPNQSYWLEGYGQYTPDAIGRHRVELSGEIEVHSPDGDLQSVRTTNCRLLAKEPRFKLKVQEITPRTEKLLFDSERLVSGGKPIETARNSYATQLRILLDFADALGSAPNGSLKATVARQMPASFGELRGEDVREGGGIRGGQREGRIRRRQPAAGADGRLLPSGMPRRGPGIPGWNSPRP